jgi:hypothetical protein
MPQGIANGSEIALVPLLEISIKFEHPLGGAVSEGHGRTASTSSRPSIEYVNNYLVDRNH